MCLVCEEDMKSVLFFDSTDRLHWRCHLLKEIGACSVCQSTRKGMWFDRN